MPVTITTLMHTFLFVICSMAERPAGSSSQDNALLSPDTKQMLRKLWNLLRKFQLPIGLILLVVYSWKKPIVLAINTLLLLYSTRPDPYSIYLFLQEVSILSYNN
jgi:hypothetical protein